MTEVFPSNYVKPIAPQKRKTLSVATGLPKRAKTLTKPRPNIYVIGSAFSLNVVLNQIPPEICAEICSYLRPLECIAWSQSSRIVGSKIPSEYTDARTIIAKWIHKNYMTWDHELLFESLIGGLSFLTGDGLLDCFLGLGLKSPDCCIICPTHTFNELLGKNQDLLKYRLFGRLGLNTSSYDYELTKKMYSDGVDVAYFPNANFELYCRSKPWSSFLTYSDAGHYAQQVTLLDSAIVFDGRNIGVIGWKSLARMTTQQNVPICKSCKVVLSNNEYLTDKYTTYQTAGFKLGILNLKGVAKECKFHQKGNTYQGDVYLESWTDGSKGQGFDLKITKNKTKEFSFREDNFVPEPATPWNYS